MDNRRATYILVALFLIAVAVRVAFAMKTPYFTTTESYFHLRQAEHIQSTGLPLFNDDLSYNGRQYIFMPLYHYILASSSFLFPSSLSLKIITNMIACSLIFAVYLLSNLYTKKKRIAYASGQRIAELAKRNLTPSKILNKRSLENAIVMDNALGGSTNTVLHLLAIANECGINLSLRRFDEISRTTAHITDLRPGGEFFMEDLEYAGGIPAAMKRLSNKLKDNPTISGKSIKEILKAASIFDSEVLRPQNRPYHKQGGIAVLFGGVQ